MSKNLKEMKKYVLLSLLMCAFWSCSVDDSLSDDYRVEILPIRSVIDMPESVNYNDTYIISYTYERPSSCHAYSDLYYLSDGPYRTVAVINTVANETASNICEPLTDEIVQKSFTFHVQNNAGTYIFQFWQGEDENGVDQFLTFEVPIEQ